ncbi:MAG: hypothetical protein ACYCYK_14460 [Candidatus Dormibacteria bacterium]
MSRNISCRDGSATGPKQIRFGNCFVVVGIVVTLPFCNRPVCLPVLWALWRKGESKVASARRLIELLGRQYPERTLHVAATDQVSVSVDSRLREPGAARAS